MPAIKWISSTREVTPSLRMIVERWLLTVESEIPSSYAITLFDLP